MLSILVELRKIIQGSFLGEKSGIIMKDFKKNFTSLSKVYTMLLASTSIVLLHCTCGKIKYMRNAVCDNSEII